ncbi:MAG: 50S ribosomal protein L31, partial [Chloroflexi bacterium]
AKCHPFFTGKQHILDIQGRVDRFKKRYAKAETAAASAEAAKSR